MGQHLTAPAVRTTTEGNARSLADRTFVHLEAFMRRLLWLLGISLFLTVPAAFGQITISMDAPTTVQLGNGLKYLIQVTNTGASSVDGIVVTDTLPNGLSANSLASNCAGATTIICDIGTLAASQSVTVAIEIVPQAVGSLTNTATATGGSMSSAVTNVIANGVILAVNVGSSNPLDVVTSNPAGLNCVGLVDIKHQCYAFFPFGTSVTLTASGPGFLGWSLKHAGSCPGTGTCTLTMTQEQLVGALFTSPVAFTLSSVAGSAVVNFPSAVDVSKGVIGGTAPYTYSLISGSLAPGTSLDPNTGKIFGTPTTLGTFSGVVQVTDSTLPVPGTATISGSVTVINPPNTQPSLLNGQYGVVFRGNSDQDSSEAALVGSLTFDGLGGVSGNIDTNCNSPAAACVGLVTQIAVAGSYWIGPDNRGLVSLNGGALIFAIAVGEISNGIANTARIIEFDDITGTGTRGAGLFRRQNPAAFSQNSFAGTYVYGLSGENGILNRIVEIGLVSLDNANNATGGLDDFNNSLLLQQFTLNSGTYTAPTAAGRTFLNLFYNTSIGVVPFPYIAYIVDANNLFLMSAALGPVEAGSAQRQANPGSFGSGSLAGPDVINFEAPSGGTGSSNSFAFLGIGTFANSTASISYDSNDDRSVQIQGTEAGPYSVAASGRATISPAGGAGLIAYLAGPDQGYVITTNLGQKPAPAFGDIQLQQGGPFSNSSFSGAYFFGDHEPSSPSGGPVTSGIATSNACTLSFTFDQSHAGGRLDYANVGSVGTAVLPSGRVATTFAEIESLGSGSLVAYLLSPSRFLIADINPGSHHPHILEGELTSASPAPTLQSIAVTPTSLTIAVGQNQQYRAIGTSSDGSMQDLTSQVNWVSSNLSAVTISPTGLATGVEPGVANIVVNFGCISSASTSPVTLTVSAAAPGATNTSLVSSPSPSVYGQQVTFTATVSPVSGVGTPTGSVTFYDGGTSLGVVPLIAGQAQLTTSALNAGTHSITAVYSGDNVFSQSTSSVDSQVVNPAALTITANNAVKTLDSPNPPFTVTYSGFVNGDGPNSLIGTLVCTTTATTTSPVGSYPITCSGLSSPNYNISFSSGTPGMLKIIYVSAGLCDGAAGHQILPPINSDGSSVYNQGRTVPAKFRVCDANGVSIGAPGTVSSFFLTEIITGVVATPVQDVVDTNVPDMAFRWDPTSQQWIFNITTVNLSAGSTYAYTITLNDGSTIMFQFGLQ